MYRYYERFYKPTLQDMVSTMGCLTMDDGTRLPAMCTREVKERDAALDSAEKLVNAWLESLPQYAEKNNGRCLYSSPMDDTEINLAPVNIFLPDILRLATNCPFADVRERCSKLLKLIKEHGVTVPRAVGCGGASAFIPPEDLPGPGTDEEKTHLLFIDAFIQNNRLDHVSQVMGYHPTYLDIFLRTQNFILRGDGPLPYDYRHFIAIMAAGRHQCSYLINLQKQEFIIQGGDKMWLKGLPYIPQKLRDLNDINKILAHRPWLLNKAHIEKLTKGTDSWSLAEVVHAIVLLAHFHSLASFVFGCGVNVELDHDAGHQYGLDEPRINKDSKENHGGPGDASVAEPEVGVETLMARMKTLSERAEEFSPEERTKRFEHVESQSAEELPAHAAAQAAQAQALLKSDISHFVEDSTFLYQDFAKRGEISDIPTFRVQDYSWDDHGYSLVNRLYSDVGNLLDEKFKTAYNLTYYTMGGRQDVDTSRFRRAIWNYIQCMFGIRHDDYDYGEVNQLLERSLKAFIKSACCFPERVTKRDYDSVLREFKHSEKVHVNLMVLEARMQAELLYALRVVMSWLLLKSICSGCTNSSDQAF